MDAENSRDVHEENRMWMGFVKVVICIVRQKTD